MVRAIVDGLSLKQAAVCSACRRHGDRYFTDDGEREKDRFLAEPSGPHSGGEGPVHES